MSNKTAIKLFENRKVRSVWNAEAEKWYISIVDVIEVLTESNRPRKYWDDLKRKLQAEGSELSEKIGQLKMQAADGKKYLTDVADVEQLFRLIQSIPSPKAEPFKLKIFQYIKRDKTFFLLTLTGLSTLSGHTANDLSDYEVADRVDENQKSKIKNE